MNCTRRAEIKKKEPFSEENAVILYYFNYSVNSRLNMVKLRKRTRKLYSIKDDER